MKKNIISKFLIKKIYIDIKIDSYRITKGRKVFYIIININMKIRFIGKILIKKTIIMPQLVKRMYKLVRKFNNIFWNLYI